MYIPYEKLSQLICKFAKNEVLKSWFYNKKVEQNVRYISKNKQNVLKRLKKKLSNEEKLNVIFYVYDETKWKCQSIYDLLAKDARFNVQVLVTKTACLDKENSSYLSDENIKKTYDFFVNKGMNSKYAYNFTKSEFIPFKKFEPDIIFYQHPWYVKTEQGPVVCSKFAITYYIPYYFPIETADIDCNLRFHEYVENYCILDDYTKEKYLKKNPALKNKLRVVGYPYLDDLKKSMPENDDLCIIYAPHWTVGGKGLAYGTFEWSGRFILDYAKSHPEIKWIFKPHSLLHQALQNSKIMTEEEVKAYYSEWAKIGIKYESGDYLQLFEKSKMMITDCSSFLGEYFLTTKPLIHLMSEKSQFQTSDNPILKTYYRVHNINELKTMLEILPEQDTLKTLRLQTLDKVGLRDNCASKNILDCILSAILC